MQGPNQVIKIDFTFSTISGVILQLFSMSVVTV